MIDFDFQIKTKLYFGRSKENKVGEILKENGATKVLLVVGTRSVFDSGLFEKVTKSLIDNELEFFVLKGVRANPIAELCREGVKLARESKVDYVLAVGGGSVIDTAKSICAGYYYEGDCFDFNLHKLSPTKALPLGVILTLSASGSEMSTSCVVQDDASRIKMGFNSELVRPVFAIENPELTFSVNKEQTGNGIVDILMHTLERYFQPSSEIEPADDFAQDLCRNTIKSGLIAIDNPCDYEARSILMLMSSLSHNGLMNIGKICGMPVHALEHALSGVYPNIAHGAGLSVLFPAWCTYYKDYETDKLAKLGCSLFNLHFEDKNKQVEACIDEFKKLFKSIGMPLSFNDLGITNPDINLLVDVFSNGGTRVVAHHKKPMDKDVARNIYELCK